VAVALVDAVTSMVARPEALGVRWPNDVEAGGRKLSGLLPERVEAVGKAFLLMGVGVNVATDLGRAPAEVRAMAVSLREIADDPGHPPAVDDVLFALLERLPRVFERLAADDPLLAGRWADLDTLRDQAVRVNLGTRVVSGVGLGIDPEGALNLATDQGPLRLFGGQVLREARPS
jgi:BirA family biotin operon repressor/biotin-[acetyl-CoA-carboxylase] ligase